MSTDITVEWDTAQRASLQKYRLLATSMLLVMAGAYAGIHAAGLQGFWAEFAISGTEAAMVGGLADWFAVTALFRHPLGLPIPHTAVLPRNKPRIAEGVGGFVERHFLDPALVAERLRSLDVASQLGNWLARPAVAKLLADRLVGSLPYLVNTIGDTEFRSFLRRTLARQIEAADTAQLVGRLLQLLRDSDEHHALMDRALVAGRRYLEENRDEVFRIVEERSRWWVPKTVDRRVAESIIDGLAELLGSLSKYDHDLRHRFDQAIDDLIRDLKESPEMRARVEGFKTRLLENPATQDYLANLWDHLSAAVVEASGPSGAPLRQTVAKAIESMGRGLQDEPAIRARFNGWVEELVKTGLVPWRREIGRFISDVITSWETKTMSDRFELAVGRDLQFIRMNGTIVGAIVGCALFTVSWLLSG